MEEKNCQILFEYLKSIVYDTPDEKPGLEDLESPYKRLGQGMEVLEKWLEEMHTYSADLSKGNLSGTLPSEENPLCMNLKKSSRQFKSPDLAGKTGGGRGLLPAGFLSGRVLRGL